MRRQYKIQSGDYRENIVSPVCTGEETGEVNQKKEKQKRCEDCSLYQIGGVKVFDKAESQSVLFWPPAGSLALIGEDEFDNERLG